MLTILSGGTGTPKLLRGLDRILPQEELSVIVNTGEDVEVSGLYVSPDLDSVTYTMAGTIDEDVWYGISEDTFFCHEMLGELGHDELLRIGDKDRGLKLYRTLKLRQGLPLSQTTRDICRKLGVKANIMPMSDDRVTTEIYTNEGPMSFHEFWVVRRAKDAVKDVKILQADGAKPAPGVVEAIEEAEGILIGPSNPVTSIGPIIAIKEIQSALERSRERVLTISPILGDSPVSGPTGVLMRGLGLEVSPLGVARIYRDVSGSFMLHQEDENFAGKIEDLGMSTFLDDLMMTDLESMKRLANGILGCLNYPR